MSIPGEPISSTRGRSKRGSKAFSGCWTCRDRRVKCDESRPSCKRCEAASLACQGYRIKLTWKGFPDNSDGRQLPRNARPKYSQRSKMPSPGTAPPPTLTRAEIVSIQHHFDAVQSTMSSSSRNLFSIFCSQPSTVSCAAVQSSDSSVSRPRSFTLATAKSALSSVEYNPAELSLDGDDRSEGTSLSIRRNSHTSSDRRVRQLHENLNCKITRDQKETCSERFLPPSPPWLPDDFQQSAYPLPFSDKLTPPLSNTSLTDIVDDLNYDLDYSLIPSDDWEAPSSSYVNLERVCFDRDKKLPRTPHIDLLLAPAEEKELIHHWITSLYLAMLPVVRIDKPQHNMFVPIALAGLNSDSQESSGGIAVFHGLCAASAFNLSILRGSESHFHQLAIKHRQLALYHLRHCMQGDQIEKESVWAAIMTLMFQEGVLGQTCEWRAHIKGLNSVIAANPHLVRNNYVARGVYESYLCLTILGNAQTGADLKPLLTMIPPDLDYVGSVHGITRPILETVLKINSLASTKPHPSQSSLDRLELQLLLYSPENASTKGLDDNSAKLLLHYSYVYKYAALIHFHRVLHKKAPDALQDLVQRAIEHLEATETAGNRPKGCIWVWPCLVISAECTIPQLQSRMLAWYECKRRHGFRNLEVACNLASEIWRRRLLHPENPGDLHWQDLIHDAEYDVLPL